MKLPLEERCACIAHYRMHNHIDGVIQQEITAYSKTKAKSSGR